MSSSKPQHGKQSPAGESRRLAMNFVLLAAGECIAKLLTFAAFSYLARSTGPDGYGTIEFTIAVMVFFTLPADLGLGAYGAREIARRTGDSHRLFREIMGLRLALAIVSFFCLMLFIVAMGKSTDTRLVMAMYGLTLLASPALVQWFFQAHDLMHWVAAASVVRQLTFATLIFALFRDGRPLIVVGAVEIVSVAATAIFCLAVARRRLRVPSIRPLLYAGALDRHLRPASVIGATEVAWAFMAYFPTVLLGLMAANESLGWFGAAHRLSMALHTFVWLYFFNLLPSMSRCVGLPKEHLTRLVNRSMPIAVWSGLFVALSITLMSREVLTILYGPNFAGGAVSLMILVWILPVAMVSGHHRYALVAYGFQNQLLRCTAIPAAAAVLVAFALVPLLGATGAAVSLLVACTLNLALAHRSVRQHIIHIPVLRYWPHPIIAAVAMVAVFVLLSARSGVWGAWAVASAVFAAAMLIAEARDVRAVIDLIRNRRISRTVGASWAR